MYKDLSKYEQSVVEEFKQYELEAHTAMRKVETKRRAMLSVLGHKADCHLCGNRHYPICKEIYDGTKSYPTS